jgi:hypothetical protein
MSNYNSDSNSNYNSDSNSNYNSDSNSNYNSDSNNSNNISDPTTQQLDVNVSSINCVLLALIFAIVIAGIPFAFNLSGYLSSDLTILFVILIMLVAFAYTIRRCDILHTFQWE